MKKTKTTTKIVLRAASKMYGESIEALMTNRVARYVRIRWVIYEACKLVTNDSAAQMGRVLGKDHTTVIHFLHKRKPDGLMNEAQKLAVHSLELAQQIYDNTLQWTALTCYNKDSEQQWKLQNG